MDCTLHSVKNTRMSWGKSHQLLQGIFQKNEINPALNTTYLCLIHKCVNATILVDFRPMVIWNTKYKFITKIIANRINPIMPSIFGPSQASFLSNRRASENAIIVEEYISHFKKMKGKNANVILKIDLDKAFDRH